MIVAAIGSLKERGGSSRVAILKYINSKYKVSDHAKLVNSQLKLEKGVSSGTLIQVKGIGASGSFKIAKSAPKHKKAAKKSATKKVTISKVVKSPKKPKAKKAAPKKVKAAKKSPKKATKPKPKKPAAKKSPKKAAKHKAKKAAKKPAKKYTFYK